MSLFVINRYDGNEESLPESKNSDDHLTALLKKIELRKKRKIDTDDKEVDKEADNEVSQNLETSIPAKRKKKRKTLNKNKETNESVDDKISKDSSVAQENDNKATEDGKIDKENEKSGDKTAPKKQSDFLILGADLKKKKPQIKRVLPDWLAEPELVSADLSSGPPLEEFASVLDRKLIDIMKDNGMTKLFPVQASVIPWILKYDLYEDILWPRDYCISAPTGSGKTLAYVLPIIQQLQNRLVKKVRCLVVLPVQELAAQVYKVIKTYTAHTTLKVALLSGAAAFHQEQNNLVKRVESGRWTSKVDIIVTTPGRLIDHIKSTPGFSLTSLRYLIIDEADRAADWLQYLPAPHANPPTRNLAYLKSGDDRPAQKLLFSATLSQDPEKLSRLALFQPKLFTSVLPEYKDGDLNLDRDAGNFAGRYTSPDELVEKAIECEALHKPLALYELLMENEEPQRTLVFTNSGQTAHRLTLLIRTIGKKKGLAVAELSALLAPSKRELVLSEFSEGKIQILVSSDALARGIDIPGVKLVVSYDLPKHIKGYIHRSGRTGRAGNAGIAISLLTPVQVAAFSRMLSSARKTVPKIEKKDLDSFAVSVDYEKHMNKVKEIIIKEETEAVNSLKSVKRKHRKQS